MKNQTNDQYSNVSQAHTQSKSVIDYYKTLAKKQDLPFFPLTKEINHSLLQAHDRLSYISLQAIPIKTNQKILTVATSNPTLNNQEKIKKFFKNDTYHDIKIVVSSFQAIRATLAETFYPLYREEIREAHVSVSPYISSKNALNIPIKIFFLLLLLLIIIGLIKAAMMTLLVINIILTIGISLTWSYKILLSLLNIIFPPSSHQAALSQQSLPIYTMLIPLFSETKAIIHHLINGLMAIDYPHQKLDIKLLLEANDKATQSIIKEIELPPYFDVLIVPADLPQTKPRACNYGLAFAKGEYITIYDAEDRPDPQQLKKTLRCFKNQPKKVICAQARLNFYNPLENWITRCFSIEYTTWFNLHLTGQSDLKLAFPLGGTSNHFKIKYLREIGGWDPYNCTEDAEIGIRLSRHGYQSTMIDSVTKEEANTLLSNWFKQRVRWNKGYMQTYLIHMHHPFRFIKEAGFFNFINFQLFVGGSIFSQFANVILWAFFITVLFILPFEQTQPLYPTLIWYLAWINLIIGNLLFLIFHFIAVLQARYYKLLIYIPVMLIYWFIMGFAMYAGAYDLIRRPSYWYKTKHGISDQFKL